MRCKQWSYDVSKFPPSMAMRIEFAAQIMKQFWICGFFFWFTPQLFSCSENLVRKHVISRKVLFDPHYFFVKLIAYSFCCMERAETEMRFSMSNSMFKTKMDIDHHSPRLMPNNCRHLNSPYSSLPTTFKTLQGRRRGVIGWQRIEKIPGCLSCFAKGQILSLLVWNFWQKNIRLFKLSHPKVGINFDQFFSYFEHLIDFGLQTQRGNFHPWPIWFGLSREQRSVECCNP